MLKPQLSNPAVKKNGIDAWQTNNERETKHFITLLDIQWKTWLVIRLSVLPTCERCVKSRTLHRWDPLLCKSLSADISFVLSRLQAVLARVESASMLQLLPLVVPSVLTVLALVLCSLSCLWFCLFLFVWRWDWRGHATWHRVLSTSSLLSLVQWPYLPQNLHSPSPFFGGDTGASSPSLPLPFFAPSLFFPCSLVKASITSISISVAPVSFPCRVEFQVIGKSFGTHQLKTGHLQVFPRHVLAWVARSSGVLPQSSMSCLS